MPETIPVVTPKKRNARNGTTRKTVRTARGAEAFDILEGIVKRHFAS